MTQRCQANATHSHSTYRKICAGTAFHSTGPIVACACIILQHEKTSDKSLCHDCDAYEEGSDERVPCLIQTRA